MNNIVRNAIEFIATIGTPITERSFRINAFEQWEIGGTMEQME